jgi:hypothetical protein
MNHPDVSVRCQRCGAQMDLTDPAPEDPWPAQQFWECPQCNRHFWTTYPAIKPAKPAAKPAAAATATAADTPAKPAVAAAAVPDRPAAAASTPPSTAAATPNDPPAPTK